MTCRPIITAFERVEPGHCRPADAQVDFPAPPPKVSPAQGAIDFHVHSEPDVFGRGMDDIGVAILAKRKGMRAWC